MKHIFGLLLIATICLGADTTSVYQRMLARHDELIAVRQRYLVAEGLDGYLHCLDNTQRTIVDEENKDRKEFYNALAQETNTDVRLIAYLRAKKYIKESPEKTWIQLPDSSWIRIMDAAKK